MFFKYIYIFVCMFLQISRLTASFSQAVDSFSVGDESQESISKSSTNINALNGMKSNSNSNISNGVHSSNSSANINGNADNITTSRSIRSIMQPLYWFGTIISLDSPGSIRRYAIPGSVLDDAGVRAVLSRRIDFSSDVVAKLKFNIVN